MTVRKQKISDPDSMMFSAQSLQKLVSSFENRADPTSDANLFQGQFIAAPVLLTLSMELALKAWWTREVKVTNVPKTHDLLKLFDGLPEQARIRLENSHPELPNPSHPKLPPVRKGLRSILASNRTKFVDWRYQHELSRGMFPNGPFNEALSSVIEEFFKRTAG
jgi:hypothetical protein